ncbi:MAG: S4 domain-containing protein [candidate division Zixibacteria bacterium]|nr:S4 domain-containing protein [candidate division Zixibacteria bacterium]
MRLDQYLSTVGLIKRRTAVKEMADDGLIRINGASIKPAHPVKIGDIIAIGGSHSMTLEVKNIPAGNMKKEMREEFFKRIDK